MSALACRILETGQMTNQHLMVGRGQKKWQLLISRVTNEAITANKFAAFCVTCTSNGLALPQRAEVCKRSCAQICSPLLACMCRLVPTGDVLCDTVEVRQLYSTLQG